MTPEKCPKCGEEHIIETPVNTKYKFGWCCGCCGYGKDYQKYLGEFKKIK